MGFLTAIVNASLKNRAVVLIATLLFILLGVQAALRLPIDAVPDVTNVQVQIITAAPAITHQKSSSTSLSPSSARCPASPRSPRSARSPSTACPWSRSYLPMTPASTWRGSSWPSACARQKRRCAVSVWQAGDGADLLGTWRGVPVRGARAVADGSRGNLDWYIGPQLRAVPGIVEINSFGGENKEYQIHIDPGRLQARRHVHP